MAAASVQVPFELLRAICTVESGLKPEAVNQIDGPSASHGLCQVKYATAKLVGYKGDIKGLYKPLINALYAAKYLKKQLTRYKGDWIKATSAYNAGKSRTSNMHYVGKVFKHLIKETKDVGTRCKNEKHPCCTGTLSNQLAFTQ